MGKSYERCHTEERTWKEVEEELWVDTDRQRGLVAR
jgi:hypothetical protein